MSAFNSSNGSDDACEFTSGSPLPTWLTTLQTIFLILSLFSSLLLNTPFTLVVIISKLLHQRNAMISLVGIRCTLCRLLQLRRERLRLPLFCKLLRNLVQYLLFLAATDNRLFRRSGAICTQLSNVLQSQQASPENRMW